MNYELNLQAESINRFVQPRRSYASVTRIENKQSITNQNNQETQEKITPPSPEYRLY